MTLGKLDMTCQAVQFAGAVALSAVDQLRAIGKVSPPLLEALLDFLCDGNEWAAERLAPRARLGARRRYARATGRCVRRSRERDRRLRHRLGKKAAEQYAKAAELQRRLTATPTAARGCGSAMGRSTSRAPPA